ncbi:HrpB1 family type III secretion system apparatus protein [Paraburkholderia sediminicola]|uniref:HrpB1 family type III secretion system apparatus protein n=1 Tax=Paraburkholderia sediminicola TaxID=458836 RepID=UPI0038BDE0F1
MKDTHCSSAALGLLLSIFAVGLSVGALPELEEMLFALRLLHPSQSVVDICEVRLLVHSRQWMDALRLLTQIDEQGGGSPIVWAMQGWCLRLLGDRDWRRCVNAVLGSGDAAAIAITAKFLDIKGMDALPARIMAIVGDEHL